MPTARHKRVTPCYGVRVLPLERAGAIIGAFARRFALFARESGGFMAMRDAWIEKRIAAANAGNGSGKLGTIPLGANGAPNGSPPGGNGAANGGNGHAANAGPAN